MGFYSRAIAFNFPAFSLTTTNGAVMGAHLVAIYYGFVQSIRDRKLEKVHCLAHRLS